jgi:hypothetical protein
MAHISSVEFGVLQTAYRSLQTSQSGRLKNAHYPDVKCKGDFDPWVIFFLWREGGNHRDFVFLLHIGAQSRHLRHS